MTLVVCEGFEKKLIAEYGTSGLETQARYASGKNFPRDSFIVSWAEWERLRNPNYLRRMIKYGLLRDESRKFASNSQRRACQGRHDGIY
jgi:hypothetical protein